MKSQFDQIDHQIIRILHNDARTSASEIARELNANERTIRKRIDRLVRLGAVRLTAIIDPEVFGYVTAVDILHCPWAGYERSFHRVPVQKQ